VRHQKLLLVFDSLFSFRSYSESNIRTQLETDFDVVILFVDTHTNGISEVEMENIEFLHVFLGRRSQSIISFFSTIYWNRKKQFSNSFRVRLQSLLTKRRLFFSIPSPRLKTFPSIPVVLAIVSGTLGIRSSKYVYRVIGSRISKAIKSAQPNLIIYLTLGGGVGLSDLLNVVAKVNSLKMLVMMDNWDNIYSKAVFDFCPDFITVWNLRAKEFAFRVHDIPIDKIGVLPSVRIQHLIEQFQVENYAPVSLVFAGGSMQIQYDAQWLVSINRELSKHNLDLKIEYLPHPINYKNLELISEMLQKNRVSIVWDGSNSAADKVLPPLDLYPKLFSRAVCVISPLSTISLEAAWLGINSIGIDFFDEFDNKQSSAFQTFEHYWDLRDFNNFQLIQNESQLEVLIKDLADLQKSSPGAQVIPLPNYYSELREIISNLVTDRITDF